MKEKTSGSISRRKALGLAGVTMGAAATTAWWSTSKQRSFDGVQNSNSKFNVMTPGARDSDIIPDVTLLTQTGRKVRLYSDLVRDSRILFSFMYVRCQGVCPATNALFQKLRRPVMEKLGPNVKFISMTLDAEHDTPEILSKYAKNYDAGNELEPTQGLAPWYFLTSTPDTIDFVRRSLGHYDPDPVIDADRTQHASLFTLGNDATNRWITMPVGLPFDQTMSAIMRFLGTTFEERYQSLPRPV